MTELWLKFKNENGDEQRVLVARRNFVIGRHSENDLSIPNSRLSRQHVKIETFAEVFIVSDCGSSNGTLLNGADLHDPVALKNGDILNLGGGLEIEIELLSDKPKAKRSGYKNDADSVEGSAGGRGAAGADSNGSAIPTSVFIIAPMLGIVFLVCGGGLLFFFGGNDGRNNGRNSDVVVTYPTPD